MGIEFPPQHTHTRANIQTHARARTKVRQRAALKFLNTGSRVKVVVQFRGREQQHMNLGTDLLAKIATDCQDIATADKPKREGNRLIMFMNPSAETKKAGKPKVP